MVQIFSMEVNLDLIWNEQNKRKIIKKVQDTFKGIPIGLKAIVEKIQGSRGVQGAQGAQMPTEGSKAQKKSAGLLGTIIKLLGPIQFLLGLRPIQDILKILMGFTVIGFIKLIRLFTVVADFLGGLFGKKDVADGGGVDFPDLQDTRAGTEANKERAESIDENTESTEENTGATDRATDSARNLTEGIHLIGDGMGGMFKLVKDGRILLEGQVTPFRHSFSSFEEGVRLAAKEAAEDAGVWDILAGVIDDATIAVASFGIAMEGLSGGGGGGRSFKDIPLAKDLISGAAQALSEEQAGAVFESQRGIEAGRVDDAFISKDGKVTRLNPEDNILATTGEGGMGGGATFNFFGVTQEEFLEEAKRILGVDINRSARF